MDFNSDLGKSIYSNREVSDWWMNWAKTSINPKSKIVADIGCGGGIYSKGFFQLGASTVISIDSSKKYIEEVKTNLAGFNPIIKLNDCTELDLNDSSVDIVFERALIHHLSNDQKLNNLKEIKRVLKPGGRAIIQDRTFQDVSNKDSRFWIRNTLFECFPRLLAFEQARRPDSGQYQELINSSGLEVQKTEKIPEIRKEYSNIEELCNEVSQRKGKSILFELTDDELRMYCQKLRSQAKNGSIVEQDLWTVWILRNP